MKRLVPSLLAAACLLPSLVAAAEPTPAVDTDVSIVSGGAVVGAVRLPRGATFRIVSDDARLTPVAANAETSFVASGNAKLIAHLDGREVMTLRGDELVVTRRR